MFTVSVNILKISRKMYTAEGIAEILINLPNDNYLDIDVGKDWHETDAGITIDNLLLAVDLTADSLEEMESLEPKMLNDSEEDQPHQHATDSCQGNNEDGDNNTQNQDNNPAVPAAVNYEMNQRHLWRKHKNKKLAVSSAFHKDQSRITFLIVGMKWIIS